MHINIELTINDGDSEAVLTRKKVVGSKKQPNGHSSDAFPPHLALHGP